MKFYLLKIKMNKEIPSINKVLFQKWNKYKLNQHKKAVSLTKPYIRI